MRELHDRLSEVRAREHTLLYLTLFVVAALISTSLLLFAVVLYVAELLESLVLSTVIVGGVLLLFAVMIYAIKLRPTLRAIREELHTIYEISTIAQFGYNWIVSKVGHIIEYITRK